MSQQLGQKEKDLQQQEHQLQVAAAHLAAQHRTAEQQEHIIQAAAAQVAAQHQQSELEAQHLQGQAAAQALMQHQQNMQAVQWQEQHQQSLALAEAQQHQIASEMSRDAQVQAHKAAGIDTGPTPKLTGAATSPAYGRSPSRSTSRTARGVTFAEGAPYTTPPPSRPATFTALDGDRPRSRSPVEEVPPAAAAVLSPAEEAAMQVQILDSPDQTALKAITVDDLEQDQDTLAREGGDSSHPTEAPTS